MSKSDVKHEPETKNESNLESKKEYDNFDWETKTWDIIDTFFKQDNI